MEYSSTQWPEISQLPGLQKPYWSERIELTIQQGLLMKVNRLVIPVCMRLDGLDRIHEAHQGIAKFRESNCKNLSMVARSEQTTGGSGKEMPNLHQTTS